MPTAANTVGEQSKETIMNKKNEEQENRLPATGAGTGLQTMDFGEDAGAGMENLEAGELRIPFVTILQTNSPQVKRPADGGIVGAQAGMIFNTATGELFDGEVGLGFVPAYRSHQFLEFTPRNLGGGFVAVYPPDEPRVLDLQAKQGKFGRLWTGTRRDPQGLPLDGTEITETYSLAGLLLPPGAGGFKAIASFASTQIKKYQTFMQRQTTMLYGNPKGTTENPLPPIQPPIWAHKWLLQTAFEKNKKGEFFGWKLTLFAKKEDGTEEPYIKSLIRTSDALYADAKEFNRQLEGGTAKADFKKADQTAGADDTPM